jgi:hypothetical protein
MISGAHTIGGQFIEVDQGFHGILVGSRVFLPLRQMMLENIIRDTASQCWPLLFTKPSHVGVDVDRLACPLHYPTAFSHQTMGQGFLPGVILSRRAIVGGGALLGDTKPPGLDICGGANQLGTCVIKFYIEHVAFTRICSPKVGIIMMYMRVSLVELPCQIVMGRIPALMCMLSGARGFLQPCPILSGSECYHPSEAPMWALLICLVGPLGWGD